MYFQANGYDLFLSDNQGYRLHNTTFSDIDLFDIYDKLMPAAPYFIENPT
jgi:hypothetical protein